MKVLKTGKKYRIGTFLVQPIKISHSVENYAYVIGNKDIGRVLFITDCSSFPYKVKGVNHVLCEANYSDEIIGDKLCEGKEVRSQSEYHMEISDTIECIKNTYNPDLNTICLIHLSDAQSNEEKFKKRVYDEVGIMPYVLTHDQTIELTKEEF